MKQIPQSKPQEKRRVLIYSIAYYPHVGGAEAAVREITDRVKSFDWTMVTLDLEKNLPPIERIGNILVYRIRCPKIFFPFAAFWKGQQLTKQQSFVFVWAIMTYAGFAGLFLKLFHRKEMKFLLTLQEGTPISDLKRKAAIVYPLFWLMFRMADKIQAISEFLAAFGRDMGHKKSIVVVPNGVDLKYFARPPKKSDVVALKTQLGKRTDDVYLITTSRLVKKNAIDDCVSGLMYLPDNVQLLIVGKGEEETRLRDLAREKNVRDRVKFFGFIPKEQLPVFLAVSDIFVRPSRSEGFGNSFIEAMAAGLPVVTTPVGGIVDFIDDHETGIFCRPDNPKSFAEAVQELLKNPPLREKIIKQGSARVLDRYGWEKVAKDMEERVFLALI